MSKYIIEADEARMLNGVADCVEQYEESENSKRTGVGSVTIFRVNDGREYTVQVSKYESGTTKVFAYEESNDG